LNTLPIPQPAFHDTTADPAAIYRYSVTAVDAKGNESPSATATLTPMP
jgi:fibronectin type 3 domain-containing protein